MKNLMNVALVIFALALLTGSVFGQQGVGNVDAPRINWVDADGDGICDNVGLDLEGAKIQKGKLNGGNGGTGLGDGSGIKPLDGTGFGKKLGDGICIDGTAPIQKVGRVQIQN